VGGEEVISKEKIREAAGWPTIREVSDMYGVPERFVRTLWEARLVEAVKLNLIRINPESLEKYIDSEYNAGQ
jgi:hypothetical protein